MHADDTVNHRLGVLISGRGSNLQALIDAVAKGRLSASIAIVISNREGAPGLERARAAGIEAIVLSHAGFATREDYDRALVKELQAREVGLVCLAGFMRLVGAPLIEAFPNRILNIHPSLLPAFPGLEAWKQALDHGVKVTGCTVHFVDQGVDSGPIIAQETVPVLEGDTPETLHARIQEAERKLYPEVIGALAEGRITVKGRQTIWRKL